jgi:hypothetical protein
MLIEKYQLYKENELANVSYQPESKESFVEFRQYNQMTGVLEISDIVKYDIDELENEKKFLQSRIDVIDSILSDLNKNAEETMASIVESEKPAEPVESIK